MKKSNLTAAKIKAIIANKFSCKQSGGTMEWIILEEFRTAGEDPNRNYQGKTYIDMFVVGGWRTNRCMQAFEIKISRQDFIKDIESFIVKQGETLKNSTQFWYVCPTGLISPEEVPEECGLYWVSESGKLSKKKVAPIRSLEVLSFSFVQSLLSRISKTSKPFSYSMKYLNTEFTEEEICNLVQQKYKEELHSLLLEEVEDRVNKKLSKALRQESNVLYILEHGFGYIEKRLIEDMDQEGLIAHTEKIRKFLDMINSIKSLKYLYDNSNRLTARLKELANEIEEIQKYK